MKLRFTGALSLLLTLGLAELVLASPSFSRVALLLPACEQPGLSASELREAVALDLRDEHLTLAPAGELSPTSDVLVRIESGCVAGGEMALHAQFADERHTRRVDLGELPPPQRARALSLAVAELLARFGQPPPPPSATEFAGTSDEPAAVSAPVATPAASAAPPPKAAPVPAPLRESQAAQPHPADAPADRAPVRQVPSEWRLSLSPELRFFDTTWLWGGRALLHYGGWSAGLDLLRAQESVLPGRVSTLLVHGSAAYAFVLRGSPESSLLEAGPRLGLGRTFMTAEATAQARASDAQDVYVDAAFGVRYSLRVSPLLRLALGGELGYARGPIGYADDLQVASTSGTFASLLLHASVRL